MIFAKFSSRAVEKLCRTGEKHHAEIIDGIPEGYFLHDAYFNGNTGELTLVFKRTDEDIEKLPLDNKTMAITCRYLAKA